MSRARQERLKEAKVWYASQNFNEDSNVVKAYRKRFNVDRTCATRDLWMLKVLSPQRQAAYESELRARTQKHTPENPPKDTRPDQDGYFYFIAGYTSGGAPYGLTWDEAGKQGLLEDEDEEMPDSQLPF